MRINRKFSGPVAACLAVFLGLAAALPAQAQDTHHSATLTQVGAHDYLVGTDLTELTTRSVTAAPPPFQPLATTIAEQTVFPMANRRAALVGFRQGADTRGVGPDGLHLHALTADEMAGGHVLSCTAGTDVQLSIQQVHSLNLRTPSSAIGDGNG